VEELAFGLVHFFASVSDADFQAVQLYKQLGATRQMSVTTKVRIIKTSSVQMARAGRQSSADRGQPKTRTIKVQVIGDTMLARNSTGCISEDKKGGWECQPPLRCF
jgi:hypothetical protein